MPNYKEAAEKLLCELQILLPYLPDRTHIVAHVVINKICDDYPVLDPSKYVFDPRTASIVEREAVPA